MITFPRVCDMPAEPPGVWTVTVAPAPARVRIVVASDPDAVRDGLQSLFALAPFCDLSAEVRGTAEIVLAEALNNIVEHAYAEYGGQIEVTLDYEHPSLCCEVVDNGLPMKDGRLPVGEIVDLNTLESLDDLPEGGYGWFLIRSLTRGMVYRRQSGRNTLAFRMEAG